MQATWISAVKLNIGSIPKHVAQFFFSDDGNESVDKQSWGIDSARKTFVEPKLAKFAKMLLNEQNYTISVII